MKRNKKAIFISISLILFILLAGKHIVRDVKGYILPLGQIGKVMGIPMVENLDFLQGKQKCTDIEEVEIYFEGTELPYSEATNTFYLSQNFQENEWQGTFSVKEKGAYLCTQWDSYWDRKADAIRDGHSFIVCLVTEQGYYEFNLEISGMPIIVIDTERTEKKVLPTVEEDPDEALYGDEVLHYGNFKMFNPGMGSEQYEILECMLEYHPKGDSTLLLDKIGYAISLLEENGENLNQSLLGMREDNSWKLNPLITDKNRIREKASACIWEKIDSADETLNTAGARMEYVELILDNDYMGLYCLVEPIDAKKLELDENDVLYKMTAYYNPYPEDFEEAIEKQWKVVEGIRVRYPKLIEDYEAVWEPLREFHSIFYVCNGKGSSGKGAESAEEVELEDAQNKVYPGNLADMMIFASALTAGDNFYKNTYVVADVAEDGSYLIRRVPWDMDYTFGNVYDWFTDNKVSFNPDVETRYRPLEFPYLIENNVDNLREILWERWITYRSDFLSTEAIAQVLLDNTEYLRNTGVMYRENERWPQYAMDLDIEYLLEFQSEHMSWLDGYILSLTE